MLKHIVISVIKIIWSHPLGTININGWLDRWTYWQTVTGSDGHSFIIFGAHDQTNRKRIWKREFGGQTSKRRTQVLYPCKRDSSWWNVSIFCLVCRSCWQTWIDPQAATEMRLTWRLPSCPSSTLCSAREQERWRSIYLCLSLKEKSLCAQV